MLYELKTWWLTIQLSEMKIGVKDRNVKIMVINYILQSRRNVDEEYD